MGSDQPSSRPAARAAGAEPQPTLETTEEHGSSRRSVSLAGGRIPEAARGGVAAGAIVTGVVVAIGATLVLSTLVGAALAALGVAVPGAVGGNLADASVVAGAAVVVTLFLAYLWGGYTAGRMARGKGVVNGLLVALLGLVLAVLVVAIATGAGAALGAALPAPDAGALPLASLADVASVVGVVALVAMFGAAAWGGLLGQRWHTRLEKEQLGRGLHNLEGSFEHSYDKTDEGTDRSYGGGARYRRGEPGHDETN